MTADMKAHAEIGLSCAGDQKGCRRCEIVGEYVPSCKHYFYGNFLFRYYNQLPDKAAETSLIYKRKWSWQCHQWNKKKRTIKELRCHWHFHLLYMVSTWYVWPYSWWPGDRHHASCIESCVNWVRTSSWAWWWNTRKHAWLFKAWICSELCTMDIWV